MQIGLLGLGKMGKGLAEKLMAEGHEVVVWNRSKETLEQFRADKSNFIVSGKLQITRSIEELRDTLRKPRVIWSMLPAGEPTQTMLSELLSIVDTGDVVIDGGNAHFKDTEKYFTDFSNKGVRFLGIGTSGGIHAVENGFSLMVGGHKEAYDYVLPALDSLSKPDGGHAYFGTGGAGHFVKMVHNGIEYGMMQAMGEGFGVLDKAPYQFNLAEVAALWQRGSIIRSFLLDCGLNALSQDPSLSGTSGYIAATGEAKWTVEQAKETHVPVDVIARSLEFREKSQYDKVVSESFAAKLVAALRGQFGGHEVQSANETAEK